jgi:hypothetical protein
MPTSPMLARLCQIHGAERIRYPHLKAVTLAQWLLESGRATSKLAKDHYNFGGLRCGWRTDAFPDAISQSNHQRSSPCCTALTEIEYITNPTVDRLLISGPDAIANRTEGHGFGREGYSRSPPQRGVIFTAVRSALSGVRNRPHHDGWHAGS